MNWEKTPLSLLLFASIAPLCAQEKGEEIPPVSIEMQIDPLLPSPEIAFRERKTTPPPAAKVNSLDDGYTINYNTVSIVEYIRFASKICNANFIYNEAELNFSVSVVSDAPITPENVMSTLIQVLRIHGLSILEQDNNLVIHKAADVKQIATIVTDGKSGSKSPIVTRVFRMKSVPPDSVAAVIRPMISTAALLETSPETRVIILTDITTNVDKVAALIEILDSPHALLEIKTYEIQNNSPEFLIDMASQLMTPIAQGNPFILVPQPLANSIFIVSTPELIQRAASILEALDTPPKKSVLNQRKLRSENVFLYKAVNLSGIDILKGLQDIANNLTQSGIPEGDLIDTIGSARYIPEADSIMFVGSSDSLTKIREFLTSIDNPGGTGGSSKSSFFVYKPVNRSAFELEKSMLEIAHNLTGAKGSDEGVIETIESVKVNGTTNTLAFSGEERTFSSVRELLNLADSPTGKKGSGKNTFFLYKIQQSSAQTIEASLKNFAASLDKTTTSDEGLIDAIHSMKYMKDTNSFLFTGSDGALKRLQELVPSFDLGIGGANNQFYIYKPKYQKGDQLSNLLKEVTENLKADQFSDQALIQTLQTMKWVRANNSLLFTGDGASIKKLEDLIATLDVPGGSQGDKAFFLYHPQVASREKTESYLKQLSDHLNKKSDDDFIITIRSMKWIEPSQSFLFQGSETSIARLKEILQTFDTTAEQSAGKPGYFLYKLQNTTGDVVEEDLENLVKNFKKSGVQNQKMIEVIQNARYVKETNSILLTGDPIAIEEAKKIIAEYDYPRANKGPLNSSFFMYKPQNIPAKQIEHALGDVSANLKKADLADPALLSTIQSMKYVETTNSIVFTGTQDSLEKVKGLLKNIDIPSQKGGSIQHVGKTTFLLYKLKNASGPQIVSAIRSMTSDLKKSGTSDKDFIAALQSAKFVKDTNSVLFTGSQEALEKVEPFVEKFDVTNLSEPADAKSVAAASSDFFVYKPSAVPGPELEKMMTDFGDHLRTSGLADPDLFNAINSMRWVDRTQSLVFTGTKKSLDQVKDILKDFDTPSNAGSGKNPLEPSIQAIDNTSFLVYKLQFHKGDEIQGALRQIAKDLTMTNAPINQNLLNSINSIQWLEVTNSLLCSGDQETLVRLRELIKNLDIPLKQVYIEILVIETSLTNALQFGLEWGSKYKYRNKFQGSMNNSLPVLPGSSSSTCTQDATMSTLNNLIPVNPPPTITNNIPFGCGFDLGIIGQVIKHNGETFLTLGSLLTAVQTDDETAIVLTPKIITQDGRTSSIFVGENVPFVGSFINNTGSTTVQTSNLEYRDVGLNLTITPVLGNSDIVTLDISLDRTQTVGDVTGGALNFNNQSAQGITTSRTTMQTTVHVPDKNFLILSGFVNNSNVKSKSGIPCLGGLPLIGAAFSKDNNTTSTNNIVIFLRPHIINSVDDMRKVTSDQEDAFRDQQGTPFLIKQFDEGMELIKSIDDE